MTSHLLGLRAENFKRLTLVDVTFDPAGGVTAIMGANEAGKSSLLDALEVAIAGRKAPKITAPVHVGAERARVVATFDDLIVTRTYTDDGKTAIEVKGTDGRRFGNSEDILRSLYSHVALDPLAFSRLTDAEQVATLLPMIGFDPAPLDERRAAAFDRRTEVNRDHRALAARVDAFPSPDPKLPVEPVSAAALSSTLETALAHNEARRDAAYDADNAERSEERQREEVVDLEENLASARRTLATFEGYTKAAVKRVEEMAPAVDADPIRECIAAAEGINARVREQQTRRTVMAERDAKKAEADELTAKIEQVTAEREAALAAARMPVPGLTIGAETGVLTLNGVPFSQASTGVKIRTGAAIAMALTPDLRVIVIRDASLLDAGNRKVLDELARENGFLVLMEIADESMPVGVVIEGGEVREVRTGTTTTKEN